MAAGTFTLTNHGKRDWLKGVIDPDADTLVGVLVDNAHTAAVTDSTYADISANECSDGDYAPVVLTTVSVTGDAGTVKLDADIVSYGSSVTISARNIYIVRRAGASLASTDLILGYMDLNDGGSANVSSTNSTFSVDWNAANGMVTA